VGRTYLELSIQHVGDDALITASGGINTTTSPELWSTLCEQLTSRPRRLVLSLSGVACLDTAGLTALVAATSRAKNFAVDFRIAAPSHPVARTLQRTLFDEVLPIYPSVTTALGEPPIPAPPPIPKQRTT
jgi:anti-sigma B factor antagonist